MDGRLAICRLKQRLRHLKNDDGVESTEAARLDIRSRASTVRPPTSRPSSPRPVYFLFLAGKALLVERYRGRLFELAKIAKEKMEPSAGAVATTVNSSTTSSSSAPTLSEHSWTCIDLVSSLPSSQPQMRSLSSTQDNPKQAQGTVVQTPSPQQQKSKVLQQDRHIMHQFGQGKSIPTYLDDFRNGFPTNGLSSVPVKWWGSAEKDDTETVAEEDRLKDKASKDSTAMTEVVNPKGNQASIILVPCITDACSTETKAELEGASLLSSIRKRNAEDGSEVLNFGITRGYGASTLTKRQKWLLSQVYGSSLPSQWS